MREKPWPGDKFPDCSVIYIFKSINTVRSLSVHKNTKQERGQLSSSRFRHSAIWVDTEMPPPSPSSFCWWERHQSTSLSVCPHRAYPGHTATHYDQRDQILWRSRRETFWHSSYHHQPTPKLCEANIPRPEWWVFLGEQTDYCPTCAKHTWVGTFQYFGYRWR